MSTRGARGQSTSYNRHKVFHFVVGIVCVALAVVLSVVGVITIRRRVPSATLKGSEDAAAAILGALGALYSVLLAFIVIVVWNHFTDAQAAVEMEATNLGDLSRLAKGFEPADEQRIRAALTGYTTTVIRDEWPAMAQGHDDLRAWKAMGNLWTAFRAINPQTSSQQALYAESLAHLGNVSDARRKRLHSLNDDVPVLMWIVLLAGAFVAVTFTYLFSPEKVVLHAVIVGTMAAMIGLNLFLIFTLDTPFRGWPRIGPDLMQEELSRIENAARE